MSVFAMHVKRGAPAKGVDGLEDRCIHMTDLRTGTGAGAGAGASIPRRRLLCLESFALLACRLVETRARRSHLPGRLARSVPDHRRCDAHAHLGHDADYTPGVGMLSLARALSLQAAIARLFGAA